MERAIVLIAACQLWSITLAGCGTEPVPDTHHSDPVTVLEGLSKDGWTLYDRVLEFTPDSLYEQINGRAELYLSYDVVSLAHATFDNVDDPALSLSLSIYDMGSPQMAFGIYSVERSTGEELIDLGRAAYRSNADLYVWHGQYYIRAISTHTGDKSRSTNLEWVRRIVAALPDSREAVPGLESLPGDGLIPDSVRYFKIDAMGLDFMTDTFTAQYAGPAGPYAVFVSPAASPKAAVDVVERYGEHAERYGRGNRMERVGEADYVVCDMGGVFDVVSTKGHRVCGVTDVEDRDRALAAAVEFCQALR
jgi:hypothetical protein